ncbi:MAG: hypothetical protein QOK48_2012 [Blastocatellia bacterium]|jgi:hypothetical protein|nr:hypothetical protein [Blastocatellia bacterium]
MRECPRCSRVYADESLRFCLDDGASLVARVSPAAQETLRINPPRATRAKPTDVLPGSRLTPPAREQSLLPWIVTGGALLLVAVMGIVITIVILANRPSAPNTNGTNLGRNTTPTPTPVTTLDLSGTKWTNSSTVSQMKEFNFRPDGTINNDPGDTWRHNGNQVTLSITNGYAIYRGTINGDRIDYKAHNQVNLDWTGTLERVR